jgi:hypothetical protein
LSARQSDACELTIFVASQSETLVKPLPAKRGSNARNTLKFTGRQAATSHGAAADHIDAFADWLHLNGYKPISITNLLRSLAGWTDWMLAEGFTA